MDGLGREGGETDSNVFSTTRKRRRVAYPFTAACQNRLSGSDIQCTGLMLNPQCAVQDYRVLVKLRSLSRFFPAFRAAHVGDADSCGG